MPDVTPLFQTVNPNGEVDFSFPGGITMRAEDPGFIIHPTKAVRWVTESGAQVAVITTQSDDPPTQKEKYDLVRYEGDGTDQAVSLIGIGREEDILPGGFGVNNSAGIWFTGDSFPESIVQVFAGGVQPQILHSSTGDSDFLKVIGPAGVTDNIIVQFFQVSINFPGAAVSTLTTYNHNLPAAVDFIFCQSVNFGGAVAVANAYQVARATALGATQYQLQAVSNTGAALGPGNVGVYVLLVCVQ